MCYAKNYPYSFFSSTSMRSHSKMDERTKRRDERIRRRRRKERKENKGIEMSNVVVISTIDLHYYWQSNGERKLVDG